MNEAALWWGLLFGSIGLGYFIYGKQQKKPIPLLCGIGLMAFPYFVSNNWLIVLIGAALMAVPYFVRLQAALPVRTGATRLLVIRTVFTAAHPCPDWRPSTVYLKAFPGKASTQCTITRRLIQYAVARIHRVDSNVHRTRLSPTCPIFGVLLPERVFRALSHHFEDSFMSKHTSVAAASALVFAIGSALAPVQQAAAEDAKGISATACQPFLPTTYNEARFQDNAIYNSSAVNQRVICPVNKDYAGTWAAGEVTLQAYIKAGASPGKVSCTLYGGGPSWGGAQAAYTATSSVVNAGATATIIIPDIADPAVPYGIEGWNVLCTLNAGMSLGGFYFVETQDTDDAT